MTDFLFKVLCETFYMNVAKRLFYSPTLQYWMLSKVGEIRRDEACLDYAGTDIVLYPCHGSKGNQVKASGTIENYLFSLTRLFRISQWWRFDDDTKLLHHESSSKCLAINSLKNKLLMEECDDSNQRQKWFFENYDASKL
jgi:polypeptide N-acetylgalactosaminyltransferase